MTVRLEAEKQGQMGPIGFVSRGPEPEAHASEKWTTLQRIEQNADLDYNEGDS